VPKPGPVRIALALLWTALVVAILASLSFYASGAAFGFRDVAVHALGYGIVALLLAGIGAGNPWARNLLALFIGWNLGLGLFNLAAASTQLPALYRLDLLILGLQCLATGLLFLPASRRWFRRPAT
jgi:hypothetical protein